MNIAIVGFGKIGQAIAKLAQPKHKICLTVDSPKDMENLDPAILSKIDVFFEFTSPEAAASNILSIIKAKNDAKIVCGTTGWDVNSVKSAIERSEAILLVSSNFSVGINVIKPCLKGLANELSDKGFSASMSDLHHQHKKDAPSGTAKTLAELIESAGMKCPIKSYREGEYVGTHTIRFESEYEVIEIRHEAKNRDVFCMGAIHKAEWLNEQPSSSGKVLKC